MNPMMERLLQKPSPEDSERISLAVALVEELRQQTESLSLEQWQEGMARLAPYRLRSSGTLKSGDIESWQQANVFVSEKVRAGAVPTWEDILKINAILLGQESSVARNEAIYIGPREALPAAELSQAIETFKSNVLSRLGSEAPTTAAALCQFWLVSLHPFVDANGRTAVLVADWILALQGYLPMSFASKLDALVAVLSDGRASATATSAILKLLNNIQHSYRIVLGK